MKHSTPQEIFWAGEFGDQYTSRNETPELLAAKTAMFARVLARTLNVSSVMEFGCNIGLNLITLSQLVPRLDIHAIEINPTAANIARRRLPKAKISEGSIFEVEEMKPCDMAFTFGVMIHLNPELLSTVYAKLARASARYVLIAEYYNPNPVTVTYRGHEDRLFKRDFAGEFLDANPSFRLVDYAFVWKRDPQFPLDDITWFLLEK